MATNTTDKGHEDMPRTFPEPVADFAMVDSQQAAAFTAVGRVRSPFTGIAEWPWLEEVMHERSQQVLDQAGEDAWRAQGGVRDTQTGRATFRKTAPLVAEIVQKIAKDHGGLIYTDDQGIGWAVRLLPSPGKDEARIGLAFSWHGDPLLLDAAARQQYIQAVEKGLPSPDTTGQVAQREGLLRVAGRLRLYSRAEQLLWLIYTAVRKQRRSVVVLADETLAMAIWGAHNRPKNWRQDIFDTLRSLCYLHVEQLHIAQGGWPRLDLHSVAVAGVRRLEANQADKACKQGRCPLWGSRKRHGHFVVQIDLGFLGVLEAHASQPATKKRQYDFTKPASEEAKKQLKDAPTGADPDGEPAHEALRAGGLVGAECRPTGYCGQVGQRGHAASKR